MTPLRKSRISRIQKVPPEVITTKAARNEKFNPAFDDYMEYVRKKNKKNQKAGTGFSSLK
jgi:hypothetical protein